MDISFEVMASFYRGNGNKPLGDKVKDCPKLLTGSSQAASLMPMPNL